jgi:MFS family permease
MVFNPESLSTFAKRMTLGYSVNFWRLSFSMFFFMVSFNLIMPELNQFITQLDGAEYKGYIIALFTLAAGLARPFSGKLADTIGRKRVMFVGLTVSILANFLYPFVSLIWTFLLLRFFHGFSTGFHPTGATAMVADILPEHRRGEGMGIFGTAMSLGLGIGQSLSTPLTNWIGINNLFLVASLVGVISAILLTSVNETLPDKQKFQRKHLYVKRNEIFDPLVTPVAITMFLSAYCSGLILVLVPDLSEFLEISNKGLFFLFYVSSTIFVRTFMGKLSDRIGRRQTLFYGMLIMLGSIVLLALASNLWLFMLSAAAFGVATGITSPTLFAWTADLSNPENKGRGTGTMFIALEMGIMFGALSTLWLYNNEIESLRNCLYIGAIMCILSVAYLQTIRHRY